MKNQDADILNKHCSAELDARYPTVEPDQQAEPVSAPSAVLDKSDPAPKPRKLQGRWKKGVTGSSTVLCNCPRCITRWREIAQLSREVRP